MLTLDDPRGLLWHVGDNAERIGCAVPNVPFRVVSRLDGLELTPEQERFALAQARPGEVIATIENQQYRVLGRTW